VGVDRHLDAPRLVIAAPTATADREINQALGLAIAQLHVAPQVRAIRLLPARDESPGVRPRFDPPAAVVPDWTIWIQEQQAGNIVGRLRGVEQSIDGR
jgi:hypothetical protein